MSCKSLFIQMNKKGSGMIISAIIGIAFFITTVIIAFVVVSNVATVESEIADTIEDTIMNETARIGNTTATGHLVNNSWKTGFTNPVLTNVYNKTSGLTISLGNFSMLSTGRIVNTTLGGLMTINVSNPLNEFLVSYTYEYKISTVSTKNLRSNFTKGIDNVSAKIPTILLIFAVVLIMGVLVLLWTQYKKSIGTEGGL